MKPNATFFEMLDMLRSALKKHEGSPSALNDIKKLLLDPDIRREFFHMLDDPDWIVPLHEEGYFDNPSQVEQVEEGSSRYLNWPESKYLARMAEKNSSDVTQVFSKINTGNPSIIGDILDAAIAMPPDIAFSLVPVICQAIKESKLWFQFKDASNLCARLAEGGQIDSAMELAESLYMPIFDEEQNKPARRDEFWYKKGLKRIVPTFVKQGSKEFLPRLCEWLKTAIEGEKSVDYESGSDYSYIWRPAIEEHPENHDYDIAGVMVGVLREGFELAINEEYLALEEVLRILDNFNFLVFKRIRLHLINEFAEKIPELAKITMLDINLFGDHQFKHEYAMLVGRRLNLLSSEEKNKWFEWVDGGPDMTGFDEHYKSHHGREATDEERSRRIQYWQFEKLYLVREHLEGDRLDFYKKMLAEKGKPDLADLNISGGTGGWGSVSPMSIEQFEGMSFELVVQKVSEWEEGPDSSFMGPSVEGLADTFKQYVSTNPVEFSAQALVLAGKPAIYVRRYIGQMSESIKGGHDVNLSPVLELCQWVIERPVEERTTFTYGRDDFTDKDWLWTRNEITGLIYNICTAKKEDVPRYPLDGLRQTLWNLISSLYKDRSQSNIEREASDEDPRVHDYYNRAINSPRGEAVQTALEYARWVANHIKENDGSQKIIPGGFDEMPEVREMLEWQIALENRTVEALSMIGSRLGLIYWIDKQWLAENVNQLFSMNDIQGWAAWNAFLVWGSSHIEFYNLLKKQFADALELAANPDLKTEDHRGHPMNRLGEHLMILYGQGHLELDDGGLLRRFFENSNPDIRRHAIGFVGQSLERDKDIQDDVIKRFIELWEMYWASNGKNDAQEKGTYLFGLWFSSDHFPEDWALEQLELYVQVVPMPEPSEDVAEQLVKIAQIDMPRSVRILEQMVRGDMDGWHIYSWRGLAKKILAQAMEVPGEAKERAIDLINYFGRRGYMDFGELLKVGSE